MTEQIDLEDWLRENPKPVATNYEVLKEYEAHKTPVPSYEEWQALNKDVNTMTELWRNAENQLSEKIQLIGKLGVQAGRMREENQQLKELLNQWVKFYPIVLYEHEDTLKVKDIIELFEKTVNAIGEKK